MMALCLDSAKDYFKLPTEFAPFEILWSLFCYIENGRGKCLCLRSGKHFCKTFLVRYSPTVGRATVTDIIKGSSLHVKISLELHELNVD